MGDSSVRMLGVCLSYLWTIFKWFGSFVTACYFAVRTVDALVAWHVTSRESALYHYFFHLYVYVYYAVLMNCRKLASHYTNRKKVSKCGLICGDSMVVDTSMSEVCVASVFRVQLIVVSMPPSYTCKVIRNMITCNWVRQRWGRALSRQIEITQQSCDRLHVCSNNRVARMVVRRVGGWKEAEHCPDQHECIICNPAFIATPIHIL